MPRDSARIVFDQLHKSSPPHVRELAKAALREKRLKARADYKAKFLTNPTHER